MYDTLRFLFLGLTLTVSHLVDTRPLSGGQALVLSYDEISLLKSRGTNNQGGAANNPKSGSSSNGHQPNSGNTGAAINNNDIGQQQDESNDEDTAAAPSGQYSGNARTGVTNILQRFRSGEGGLDRLESPQTNFRNNPNYKISLESSNVNPNDPFPAEGGFGNTLEGPLTGMNLPPNGWSHIVIDLNPPDASKGPPSDTYHLPQSRAMIIGNMNSDKTSEPADNRLDASEFIFQTWADQATKQNKPVNSLQFIGQKMVANEDTIQDIEGAFEANIVPPGIATMKLNYNEDEGSPRQYYFNRLSDGPNGSPINYMLKDHVQEMNGLQVVSISAWNQLGDDLDDATQQYALFYELGQIPAASAQGGSKLKAKL